MEVVGRDGEVVLEAHGEGGPSLRLTEDTVSMERVHDLREGGHMALRIYTVRKFS